ncbi:hypothetical protein jhhlp_002929 [Lomentospora prolificans]|uniref:Concentrative nucleoside transporter C-terminal domain-containing protein n=1 Tax=Lomentospora prolificans TaxID=41688 RepID=A0A2N3NFG3_9PEZI|nr:hypothetical protein jhhlp_002929 [Lomentospora prolificans]
MADLTCAIAAKSETNDNADVDHGQSVIPEAGYNAERRLRHRLRSVFAHLAVWLVMTGWWVAGLVLHRHDLGWLIPFLVWLGLSIRLLTLYLPLGAFVVYVWRSISARTSLVTKHFSQSSKLIVLTVLTIVTILAATFSTKDTVGNTRADRAISLLGLAVFLGAFWATSKNRRMINWQPVVAGVLVQFLLGLFVLRTRAGYDIFDFVGFLAKSLLGFSGDAAAFLTSAEALKSGWFLIIVLPPMIFFVSFVHLLHYWGWVQWLVRKLAHFFLYAMGISGAEAVAASASPFLGQGESAVLIKEFLPLLTHAEIHQVMASGFATIAGSVLSAYIGLGISPLVLVSSCVMSIPAAITISKLRYPETEDPQTSGGVVRIPEEEEETRPHNSLHAVAKGSWMGIKIAGMVAASVLCILALLALVNGLLKWWGSYLNIDQLSVQLIVGYLFYPIAFLLGVERDSTEILKVAQLIGMKVVTNEFVAKVIYYLQYSELTQNAAYESLSSRSRLIAMYALCGFGNISAVGVQIGALSQLAPGRAAAVTQVAVSALVSGIFATLTSASIAGMLMDSSA